MSKKIEINCQLGTSASQQVLLGFAPSSLLYSLSYADVLNEDTGKGYQRRFNAKHSQDFRSYIRQPKSATLPLTFNLRPDENSSWHINETKNGLVRLVIDTSAGKVLTQVDCQHRLGYLGDLNVSLPFMFFLGLTIAEEMEVFNIINSKAKGLSTSLLDFHDSQLSKDLATDRPEIFIALYLNSEPSSPWYRQLDLGGTTTSGIQRRASLRTMQKAVKRFLISTRHLGITSTEEAAAIVLAFWQAIAEVLSEQWVAPRKHMLTKGVGVYSLMEIAADIYSETRGNKNLVRQDFVNALLDFVAFVDWTSSGTFKGLGGQVGVRTAVEHIREIRRSTKIKVVQHGE